MMTFFAPPARCLPASALVVKKPVDSNTYSAPTDAQSIFAGSRCANTLILSPLTTIEITFDAHRAGKLAVRGVVLREVRVGLRIAEVVDRDDLDFVGALWLRIARAGCCGRYVRNR